ncbi:MAG: hypothetical protein DWQ05_03080 [Calditrichaeota bacterium]|nr:MAG: hypothetical protein DWQ05_03080 [Calditrichota bacterium]
MEKHDNQKPELATETQETVIQKPLNQLLAEHPDWSAFGLFFFFTVLFFFDVIFTNKVFIPAVQNPVFALAAPLKDAFFNQGIFPQWSPFIFAGMPSFASLIYAPLAYFPNVPFLLADAIIGLPPLLFHVIHYPIAGIGVYLFLRDRQVAFVPAMLGGMAFMFSPHLVAMETAGHSLQLMTSAWLPLALWSFSRLLRCGGWFNFALASLILGFQFQSAHIQIIYYSWIVFTLYFLFFSYTLLREKKYKRVGILILFFVGTFTLGFSLAAMKLLPIYEYLPHSIRGSASILAPPINENGFELATNWSFSAKDMLTFLIPSFLGFGGSPNYWGAMPSAEHPNYAGILILVLAFIALIFRRKETIVIFLGTSLFLALIFAFGRNLSFIYKLAYDYLPFYDTFRHPIMIMVIVHFCLAILAGLGLQYLMDKLKFFKTTGTSTAAFARRIYIAMAEIVSIALLLTVFKNAFFDLMQNWYPDQFSITQQLKLDRIRFAMLFKDWWLVTLWICGGLFFMVLALKKKSSRNGFALGILIITLADIWIVDFKLNKAVGSVEAIKQLETDEITAFLKSDTTLFRILPTARLFGDLQASAHGIQSLGGTHPARLRLFQDFITAARLDSGYAKKYYQAIEQADGTYLQPIPLDLVDGELRMVHQNLVDFLNVKYILSQYPISESGVILRKHGNKIIDRQQFPVLIYENLAVLPRAFLVGQFAVGESPEAILKHVLSPGFDPRQKVVLTQIPPGKIEPDSTSTCEILSYNLNKIQIKTSAQNDQLLILSDSYYKPGWHARIDGKPAKILAANYAFRAVPVPAGNHLVDFTYSSRAFNAGVGITCMGTLIVFGCFFYNYRRKMPAETQKLEEENPNT